MDLFRLCTHCMKRQGLLQVHVRENDHHAHASSQGYDDCYICNGLMFRLGDVFALVEDAIKEYEFRSFLIGATVPHEMLEREDEVRARLKVKGMESIKGSITRELGTMLASRGFRVDYIDPDIDIHVDLTDMRVNVRARPVYLLARYRKSMRGLRQKGSDNSIESIVRRWIIDMFSADDARFLWVGGEDRDSLVLGDGRPFFIKVVNARRRGRRYDHIGILSSNGVDVWIVRRVEGFPSGIRFMSRIRLFIECEPDIMERVGTLTGYGITVMFREDGRYIAKRIHRITDARYDEDTNVLELEMLVDGGFTVKRFVEGIDAEPSLKDLLAHEFRFRYFDVLEVSMLQAS